MIPEINDSIDIKEEDIAKLNHGKILKELLTDHTKRQILRHETGDDKADAYIIWATDDYVEDNGEEYRFECEIKPELVIGEHRYVIMPRVLKDRIQQTRRSKDKAEVFTPSWVCNAQNNLIDEAWFGSKDVFNREIITEEGIHTWEPTETVSFEGTGKTWKDYIRDTRMEITCGEAPYLVSRYDTTTGEEIPLKRRIGLLDRKMRVINENVTSLDEWKKWAKIACRNIYGYEWQGDNLLLAREALFYTLLDYYEDIQKRLGMKVKRMPTATMQSFAYIISWNIWQMDGLKFVIPGSCHEYDEITHVPATLFDEAKEIHKICQCQGCLGGDNYKHNGIYPKIRDWKAFDDYHLHKDGWKGTDRSDIEFIDYVYKNKTI